MSNKTLNIVMIILSSIIAAVGYYFLCINPPKIMGVIVDNILLWGWGSGIVLYLYIRVKERFKKFIRNTVKEGEGG